MKVNKTDGENIELPEQFEETVRTDLIRRSFNTSQANKRMKYGIKPGAGMRHKADLRRKRDVFKSAKGRGMSRVPRKTLSASGSQFYWVGAVAPGTVGGRKAHPPKKEKDWSKDINVKEDNKAIRSAISASFNEEFNSSFDLPSEYPLVLDESFEELSKTKEVAKELKDLGFDESVPITIVTDEDSSLKMAANNLERVNVVEVTDLEVEDIAPSGNPRPSLWTEKAVNKLEEEDLF